MFAALAKGLAMLLIKAAGGKVYKGKKNPVDHIHWK